MRKMNILGDKMNHKQLLANLKRLGINQVIADKNAGVNDNPAVLLRWDGKEEYYTGYGSSTFDDPEIEEELKDRWADKNLQMYAVVKSTFNTFVIEEVGLKLDEAIELCNRVTKALFNGEAFVVDNATAVQIDGASARYPTFTAYGVNGNPFRRIGEQTN